MADLKFEEAETAFNNQDYEITIKKLDEFDKLLGSIKDKSLYLRIISQDKMFEPDELYDNESNFNLLFFLKKNTNAYLKAMESPVVFRAIADRSLEGRADGRAAGLAAVLGSRGRQPTGHQGAAGPGALLAACRRFGSRWPPRKPSRSFGGGCSPTSFVSCT